ncbi:unnamed protein product [Lactuca saligna]|uniref:Uncharacterized protein n=1 Tax=Lactuca saligna TaxID=75948 RepID=A0AA35VWC3_LACSI|nr:unnamed protein product [Lactuca saligna]
MKATESFPKRAKDMFDSNTNKNLTNVVWCPTDQMKQIPIVKNFCDGSLRKMEYWVYDVATTSVVIKFPDGVFHIVDKRDLLQFGERDIHTLAHHEILCHKEIF